MRQRFSLEQRLSDYVPYRATRYLDRYGTVGTPLQYQYPSYSIGNFLCDIGTVLIHYSQ
jgi:hypothetical protein